MKNLVYIHIEDAIILMLDYVIYMRGIVLFICLFAMKVVAMYLVCRRLCINIGRCLCGCCGWMVFWWWGGVNDASCEERVVFVDFVFVDFVIVIVVFTKLYQHTLFASLSHYHHYH